MRHGVPHALAAAAFAAAVALSACSGSSDGKPTQSQPQSTATSSGSSSSSATPTGSTGSSGKPKPKPPARNPLTGGKPTNNGVVAVKVDDTSHGRPQVGIDRADVVYIEQVEGGLTRLLAIYNSSLPTVEAVRSTRASDPELVAQYGHIAYVTSGGAHNPLKILDASKLKTSINDRGGPGFQRDGGRFAPYNLRADLGAIAKKLKAPKSRPVGFHWAWDTSQLKGQPDGLHVRTAVGSTSVAFDYNRDTEHYRRLINGTPQRTANGTPIVAANVLVQFCSVTTYRKDIDVNGSPSKFTHTIGHGKAVLFRNGKRLVGTWARKHYDGGTHFLTKGGKEMLFRPGQVWVVLVSPHAPLP
jgi:hypothetical protein